MTKCPFNSSCSYTVKTNNNIRSTSNSVTEKYCNSKYFMCDRYILAVCYGIANVSDSVPPEKNNT